MNIIKESTGDLTATLTIEIQESDYIDNVNKILKDYQRKATIPGFRPGNVPMSLVKKKYGSTLVIDEVNKIVSESLEKYLIDEKIEILGNPLPNSEKQQVIDIENEKSFSFFFDIGLRPEFEVQVLEKTKVNYYEIIPSEEDVEKYLLDIRKRFGTQTFGETTQDGDLIHVDIAQIKDGEIAENGITNKTVILIDYIKNKNLREKFLGLEKSSFVDMNPMEAFENETEVTTLLNIPKNSPFDFSIDFRFTITNISRVEPAEINEELLSKVFVSSKLTSEEELRNKIREEIYVSFINESDRKFLMDVTELLIKETEIDFPHEFMKRWILESNRNKNKISPDQLELQYDSYIEALKWQLIEDKLMKEQNFEITEQAIKDELASILKIDISDDLGREQFDSIYTNIIKDEKQARRIQDRIYENKLIEILKSKINLKIKEVSYQEFANLATEK